MSSKFKQYITTKELNPLLSSASKSQLTNNQEVELYFGEGTDEEDGEEMQFDQLIDEKEIALEKRYSNWIGRS